MIFRRALQGKNETMTGLDFGACHVKAAVVCRQGDRFKLAEYAIRKISTTAKGAGSEQKYAAALEEVLGSLKSSDRRVSVSISCPSATVCHTEFPRMPLEEVKSALKLNSARYLRRDFTNYYLDAVELVDGQAKEKGKPTGKMQILVGGASKEDVGWYRNVLQAAKLRPEAIELAAVSVVSALQLGQPELCEKHAVLLLDIGARATSINFLYHGQPFMTRIMQFGGEHVIDSVAQALDLERHEADKHVTYMSDDVVPQVQEALAPLSREIRSSIDFFERQHDCVVEKLLACGGTARLPRLLEFLGSDVGLPLTMWNPIETYETGHFNGDSANLMLQAPSLAAAVGVAASRI